MTKEELIALAKELGLELTEADFKKPGGELNDSDLETVTGGADVCACVLGGGTKKAMGGDVCACVGYGQGGDYLEGKYWCMCLAGGFGGSDSVID